MSFFTYVIYSASRDKYYVGCTGDALVERLRKHNSRHRGFTGQTSDWVYAHVEEYATKKQAYRREREIKSWKSRKRISILTGKVHPG